MYLLGHTAAIPDMVVIQQAAQNATPLLEINIICLSAVVMVDIIAHRINGSGLNGTR